MLAGPDFHISLSLCDTCPSADIDDAANALLACFASRGKTLDLLKAVIQKEVQNTGKLLGKYSYKKGFNVG